MTAEHETNEPIDPELEAAVEDAFGPYLAELGQALGLQAPEGSDQ